MARPFGPSHPLISGAASGAKRAASPPREHPTKTKQVLPMDILALATMKNAANRDMKRELQNSVNRRDFERTWRFQAPPGSTPRRVALPPSWDGLPRSPLPIVAAAPACRCRRAGSRSERRRSVVARGCHTLGLCAVAASVLWTLASHIRWFPRRSVTQLRRGVVSDSSAPPRPLVGRANAHTTHTAID